MRTVLLGTDWWTDCDDAVALRLLSHFVRKKEISLAGIGINGCMQDSVASLQAFLQLEGLTDVPIGIDVDATDFGGNPPYQKRLAARCPAVTNDDAEDAVRLYRRILAQAEAPIEIVEIGYLQVIADVLESQGDDISEKSGLELVQEKVKKMWVMAGKWDADGEKENNFCRNDRARNAGERFCRLCPVPITFLGWEVGFGVLTGGNLSKDDPLAQVLQDHGSAQGRHSWDPMLMLLALIGDEAQAGYDTVRGTASVDAKTGENHFLPDASGSHCYVIKNRSDDFYQREINRIIEKEQALLR